MNIYYLVLLTNVGIFGHSTVNNIFCDLFEYIFRVISPLRHPSLTSPLRLYHSYSFIGKSVCINIHTKPFQGYFYSQPKIQISIKKHDVSLMYKSIHEKLYRYFSVLRQVFLI